VLSAPSTPADAVAARPWPLLVPFAYFFCSRVPSAPAKLGWTANYLLPVLGLAVAAHGGWGGMLPAALMLVAVYAAYEFGYLVNDTLAIAHEANPTLRLDDATRAWLRRHLGLAFAGRALACLGALAALEAPQVDVAAAGWLLIWPCFALYNRWRGRITIALHFALVSLRFGLPIVAATGPASFAPQACLLLLLYAVPNSFEAAWKARYGMPALRRVAGDEDRFRIAWYLALTALALALLAASPQGRAAQVFALACAYYLAQRMLAGWLRRRGPVARG
jgi:hypothetical protein